MGDKRYVVCRELQVPRVQQPAQPQLQLPQQDVRLQQPGGGVPASAGEPGGANESFMKLPPQMESANFIRGRIAALEQALASLQLDNKDDEDSEDDLWDPLDTIKSLVKAGLAKRSSGGDSVAPGAA